MIELPFVAAIIAWLAAVQLVVDFSGSPHWARTRRVVLGILIAWGCAVIGGALAAVALYAPYAP